MDVGELLSVGIKIDLSPLDRGFAEGEQKAKRFDATVSNSMGAFERAARRMGDETSKAGRAMQVANDNAAGAARRAALAYDSLISKATALGTIIGTIIGLLAANVFATMADKWSDLSSRVGLAVGNMNAAGVVMDRLQSIARRTYCDVALTTESFIGNAGALKELGYSTRQQLDFTEALNNALVVSGAKAERAAQVQDALGKAMAIGSLRGDELNTVIKVGGRVAEVLAAQLGVGVNQLRGLGAQGKITGDVIYKALTSRLQELRDEADAMPATIGDAFTLIRNSLLGLIGTIDQTTGISSALSNALIAVADGIDALRAGFVYLVENLDKFIPLAVEAGMVLLVGFGPVIISSMVSAFSVFVRTVVSGIAAITAAMAANPIGAIAIALVAAVSAAYYFRDEIKKAIGIDVVALIKDAANYVINSFTAAFEDIKFLWNNFPDIMEAAGIGAANAVITAVNAMVDKVRLGVNDIIGIVNKIPGVQINPILGGNAIDQLDNPAAARLKAANDNHAAKTAEIMSRDTIGDFASGFKTSVPGVISLDNAVKGLGSSTGKASKEAERAAKAYARIVLNARQFIESQELEARTLGMSRQEANRLRYEQELLNKAAEAHIKLTPKQTEELKNLAAQMAATEERTTALKAAYDFGKDLARGVFADFAAGIRQGESLWDSFKNAALNALNKIADKLIEMAADDLVGALFNSSGGGGPPLDFIIGGFKGFADGGYTGGGAANRAAGVVHGGEYVFTKAATDRIGVPALERLHAFGRSGASYANNNAPPAANSNQSDQFYVSFAPVFNGTDGSASSEDAVQQMRKVFDVEFLPRTIKAIKEAKTRGLLK